MMRVDIDIDLYYTWGLNGAIVPDHVSSLLRWLTVDWNGRSTNKRLALRSNTETKFPSQIEMETQTRLDEDKSLSGQLSSVFLECSLIHCALPTCTRDCGPPHTQGNVLRAHHTQRQAGQARERLHKTASCTNKWFKKDGPLHHLITQNLPLGSGTNRLFTSQNETAALSANTWHPQNEKQRLTWWVLCEDRQHLTRHRLHDERVVARRQHRLVFDTVDHSQLFI